MFEKIRRTRAIGCYSCKVEDAEWKTFVHNNPQIKATFYCNKCKQKIEKTASLTQQFSKSQKLKEFDEDFDDNWDSIFIDIGDI